MAVNEGTIPDDETLDGLDRNALRRLAGEHNVPADKDQDVATLRRNLKRKRQGGQTLECPNAACEHRWIYLGSADFRTSCPNCGNSVRIEANRIED